MIKNTRGAVVIQPADTEGTTTHEQWSHLWPKVSQTGEVVGWVRSACTSETDAWSRVASDALDGVSTRVEMRRVTVEIDAWFAPQPPSQESE